MQVIIADTYNFNNNEPNQHPKHDLANKTKNISWSSMHDRLYIYQQ